MQRFRYVLGIEERSRQIQSPPLYMLGRIGLEDTAVPAQENGTISAWSRSSTTP